jgi:hypothetical protein
VPEATVRAQYTDGWVAGQLAPGYVDEPDVAPTPAPRPMRPSGCSSTTGAGLACPSTYARASACPGT